MLPLQFLEEEGVTRLGLTGREVYTIQGLDENIQPQSRVTVVADKENGSSKVFQAIARLDTPLEVEYYRNGGILPMVLRNMS